MIFRKLHNSNIPPLPLIDDVFYERPLMCMLLLQSVSCLELKTNNANIDSMNQYYLHYTFFLQLMHAMKLSNIQTKESVISMKI